MEGPSATTDELKILREEVNDLVSSDGRISVLEEQVTKLEGLLVADVGHDVLRNGQVAASSNSFAKGCDFMLRLLVQEGKVSSSTLEDLAYHIYVKRLQVYM